MEPTPGWISDSLAASTQSTTMLDRLSQRLQAYLAQQLGHPSGWFGHVLIHLLNRENAGMNQLALECLSLQSGSQILEIGFGGGYLIEQMLITGLPSQIDGIDYSADVVTAGQRKFQPRTLQHELKLQQASVEALPFADGYFDAIVTVHTIYFWPTLAQGLTECLRVLKPGGRLVVGYDRAEFLEQQGLTKHGFKAYSREVLEANLKSVGFIQIQTRTGSDNSNGSFFCSRGERPC